MLKPQSFLLVDAVVNLMEESYIKNKAKGVSVSATSTQSMNKLDMVSKLFQKLETQIRYRFFDRETHFKDTPRYNNVVFLNDYKDFKYVDDYY